MILPVKHEDIGIAVETGKGRYTGQSFIPASFLQSGSLGVNEWEFKSPITDFLAIPYLNVGVTSQRPGNADNGFQFFDVTLRKPIWWNGSSWVDAKVELRCSILLII